tara:strand:+ start:1360 stop:2637 length:1278 start_codon:yes stop_codon:yes gene_type:complete
MTKIKKVNAREIIDSRGNPTIECDLFLDDNSFGRSSIPSGASTGEYEAVELRDNNIKRFLGKGVQKAIKNINDKIIPLILDKSIENFEDFDKLLIEIDGTKNKSNMGANSILALSLAFAKASANSHKKELHEFLSASDENILPVPMINIINGGAHAENKIDFQEFMIAPIGANSFKEALQFGSEIFHTLKSILKQKGLNTNVGDEGGFAPDINSSKEVIDLILEAIHKAGFNTKDQIKISLDIASSEFFKDNKYFLNGENKFFSSDQFIVYIKELSDLYPIYSIEDCMSENDWEGWQNITKEMGKSIQLVGDDLFVTNQKRLQKGIEMEAGNSILVKLNQIGTLLETLQVINLAKKNNYSYIISHRSGETEDTTIADLAVATSSGQIKTGSICRTDRTAKYNQLIRIEEKFGEKSKYAGKSILKY